MRDAPTSPEKCLPDCPECGGNQHIGGDTQSPWACSVFMRRWYRLLRPELYKKRSGERP